MVLGNRNYKVRELVSVIGLVALTFLLVNSIGAQSAKRASTASAIGARTFATPEAAVDALIDAAEKFDQATLEQIFGPEGHDIVYTGEPPLDKEQATTFVQLAREKKQVAVDPKTKVRAFLTVGQDGWPFPVPLVKHGGKWSFDSKTGLQEIIRRRVGRNELDAIEVCRGYVEAQHSYALKIREGYEVNQYAQRLISTQGKQDGLAWQNSDGTWDGPVGEPVARAIEKGYSAKAEPYRGYVFKVLKGQGPAAPLGQMDYVVKGVMIGGFALVASPAQYGVSGVKSFIVSQDGVVYEKDLGPNTLNLFNQMERFNPDNTWHPVEDEP